MYHKENDFFIYQGNKLKKLSKKTNYFLLLFEHLSLIN